MLKDLFKSVIDADEAPVVICGMDNIIAYMNPASVTRYGNDFTGQNIMEFHNEISREKIYRVIALFKEYPEVRKVYTYRNDKENKDVYIVALRNGDGALIGYYEKHEYRNAEISPLYKGIK